MRGFLAAFVATGLWVFACSSVDAPPPGSLDPGDDGGGGSGSGSGGHSSSGSGSGSGGHSSSGSGSGSGGHSSSGSGSGSGGGSGSGSGGGSGSGSGGGSGSSSGGTPGSFTFGSHPMPYPTDVLLPSGGQAALDQAVEKAYDAWKAAYVKQGCGGYYVLSGGGTGTDVGDEVSEGHGYGMVVTAIMAGYDANAKTVFDGMYAFFQKFPTTSHKNLMGWTVDVAGGCKFPSGGSDSATDGDLDVAYALLLADKQWPGQGYLDKAKLVIADLEDGDQNKTTHLTTLGDWSTSSDPDYFATRPSDFMLDHYRAFGTATGDAVWTQDVDATYTLIATMQSNFSPNTGLLPDFVVNTNTTPAPAQPNFLEGNTDGEFAYNSCRTPWRIASDYIVSKDARAKTAIQKMNTWVIGMTGGDPSQIMDGYTLSGGKGSGQSGSDPAFTSPFGVAAMLSGNQAWLDAIWGGMGMGNGYYGDSITMLDMIVMSGNWWSP